MLYAGKVGISSNFKRVVRETCNKSFLQQVYSTGREEIHEELELTVWIQTPGFVQAKREQILNLDAV